MSTWTDGSGTSGGNYEYYQKAKIPTKIILPIFTPQNDGADATEKPGDTKWTEGFETVTSDRNPLSTKNSAYHCDSSWVEGDAVAPPKCQPKPYATCYRSGSACPLDHSVCKVEYCELQRWREIIDLYQAMSNVEVLALVETKVDGTLRPVKDIEKDIKLYKEHVPAIRGFYFNEVGTATYPVGTGTHIATLLGVSNEKLKTCPRQCPFRTEIAGHSPSNSLCYSKHAEATGAVAAQVLPNGDCSWCCLDGTCTSSTCTVRQCSALDNYFVTFGVGEPLFDTDAVVAPGAPDLWVTLSDKASQLGVWTPYSWFSSLTEKNGYQFASKNWGALVTDVTNSADYGTAKVTQSPPAESILTKLFDRGYGYVYLTTGSSFATTSAQLDSLITGIQKKKAKDDNWAPARRLSEGERVLQEQDDGVSAARFECDDTLFECQPVCVETMGVTRSKVSAEKCSGIKPEDCSCRCFYDAYWTCEGNTVVCKATITGGVEQAVGDLVCATRGTPKPNWDATAVQRKAGECERLPVLREERPTQACLAEHAASNAKDLDIEIMDLDAMATAGVPTLLAAMAALFM